MLLVYIIQIREGYRAKNEMRSGYNTFNTNIIGWVYLITTVLGPRRFKLKVPTDLVSGEGLFPDLPMVIFLLYPYIVESKERGSKPSVFL